MPKKPTLRGRRRGTHTTIAEIAEPLVQVASKITGVTIAPSLIQAKRGGKIRSLTLIKTNYGLQAKVIGPHTVQLINLFCEPQQIKSLTALLKTNLKHSFDRINERKNT